MIIERAHKILVPLSHMRSYSLKVHTPLSSEARCVLLGQILSLPQAAKEHVYYNVVCFDMFERSTFYFLPELALLIP